MKQKKKDKIARMRDERREQRVADRAAVKQVQKANETRGETCGKVGLAGELMVSYAGDFNERVEISWVVDLRRLRQQNRCGIIRRFPICIRGFEAPFLLSVVPSGAASFSVVGKQLLAAFQLKCVDPKALPVGSCRVGVTTDVGVVAPHEASGAHDFAVEATCRLAPALDLTEAACADTCVVRIFLTPP